MLAASLSLVSPQTASSQDCTLETAAPDCNDGYALNGYWWHGFWIPGLPTLESWFAGSPVYAIGNAVFYAPWIMRATAELRELSLHGYVDGVSGLSCADVGLELWIRRPGHEWEGPFLNVDCAQRNDMYGIIVWRAEVIELGFETAERWGMVERTGGGYKVLRWRTEDVEVSKLPPEQVSGSPVPLREWWLERFEPVSASEFLSDVQNGYTRPLYRAGESWRFKGEWIRFAQPVATPTATPEPTATPTATETVVPTPFVPTGTPSPMPERVALP